MKILKFALSMVVCCLSLNVCAFAQDPLEVGPDVYKLVFENEKVRVMEVTFAPGAKIGTHSHPDHLAYMLSGGKLKLSYPDGSSKEMSGEKGQVFWINAETHAAENIEPKKVKILVVELKPQTPSSS